MDCEQLEKTDDYHFVIDVQPRLAAVIRLMENRMTRASPGRVEVTEELLAERRALVTEIIADGSTAINICLGNTKKSKTGKNVPMGNVNPDDVLPFVRLIRARIKQYHSIQGDKEREAAMNHPTWWLLIDIKEALSAVESHLTTVVQGS